MNKAFVREPEDSGERHCPRCGSLGVSAGAAAVEEHLRPEALANLSQPAWFCPFPRCEVAYFDTFERSAGVDQLRYPVWPKDAEAPLCSCFGLTLRRHRTGHSRRRCYTRPRRRGKGEISAGPLPGYGARRSPLRGGSAALLHEAPAGGRTAVISAC